MRIPVQNNTKMTIYVGAAMVPAGETRLFEEHEVPPHLRPQPPAPAVAEEPPPNPLAELLKKTVKEIILALSGLTDEQLTALGELEQTREDIEPRKTLLSAIAEDQLLRSDIAAELKGEVDVIAKGLTAVGTLALPRMRTAELTGENRQDVLDAIDAEIAARAKP